MGDSGANSGGTLTTIAALLLIAAGCSSKSDNELWESITWPGNPNLPAQAAQGKPVLYVRFDLSQLRSARTKRIEFPLPDGTSIFIVKTKDEHPGEGGFIWHGNVEGDDKSIATLSIIDDVLVGDVVMSDARMYRVDQVDVGVQVIFELDPSKFPAEARPVEAEEPVDATPRIENPKVLCEEKIDVMVVYTEAACAASFSGASPSTCSPMARVVIKNRIQQAMGETNSIFENSETTPRISVVHVVSAGDYSEAIDLEKDLTRLKYRGDVERQKTNEDPYLDDVHGFRDQYGADVVSLITKPADEYTDGSACGRATLMRVEASWFEKDAFTVVPVDCIVGNFSFGHELGHLMGANHEGVDTSQLLRIPGNRGFVKTNPHPVGIAPWRTVMAENNSSCLQAKPNVGCIRLPFFSNSTLEHAGDPLGTDDANNSQVVEETADTVARFRRSLRCDNE